MECVYLLDHVYEKDGEEYKPLFLGESFQEKLDAYDFIEDTGNQEDNFMLGVLRRLTYLITLWFLGRAESSNDFTEFDKDFLAENSTKEEAGDEKSLDEVKEEEKNSNIEISS